MGDLFGKSVMPTVGTSIVGPDTQRNFFNALYGSAISPNDAGGWQFNQMPTYGGQLTPDMGQSMLPNVWNSWSPQSPGMGMMNQAGGYGMQLGAAAPNILNGGAGSAAGYMNNLAQYGSAGPGGDISSRMAQGLGGGPMNYLQQYMGGGQQVMNPMSQMMMGGGRPSYIPTIGGR